MNYIHNHILALIFALFAFHVYSQQNYFETLERQFDSIENESSDKALLHAQEMISYSIDSKNKTYIVSSYVKLATAYENLAKSDSAVVFYDKALGISRTVDSDTLFAFAVIGMSRLNSIRGDQERIVELIFEALKKIENDPNPKQKHELYYKLSEVHRELGSFDKAKYYLQLIIEETELDYLLAAAYNSLGLIQYSNKEYNKGKANLLKSMELYKEQKDNHNICKILINLGAMHYKLKKLEKSKEYLIEASKLTKEFGYINLYSMVLINLSVIYHKEKDYEKELVYLKKAEELAKETGNYQSLSVVANNMMFAYALQSDMKNVQRYAKRYRNAIDSLYKTEQNKKIFEIETKYETSKKELEIARQKELVLTQRTHIVIAIVLVLLLSIILFMYIQRLKSQKLLYANQKELNEEKISNLLDTHKLQKIKAYVDGQNKERERISKDLHDGIGGNLAAIKMRLNRIKNRLPLELEPIITSVDSTYNEIRSISHDLMPKNINHLYFTDLMKELVGFSTSKDIEYKYYIHPEKELNNISESLQLTIYRIIQELITNINKHARATEVSINITIHEETNIVNMIVEDNGSGFNTKKANSGVGLRSIKQRISDNSGLIKIDSNYGIGTVVCVELPIG
ncbi:signal transduction histidine kinase [Aquimarina sp. EL_43]|uniref:tetratricopeptide repeat-containing sensor histidine kinase n=1 Tax=unclassified Aquimarina TaxID=2627091 RepID=UPI0018C8DCFA|nr:MULTISPECIES: tetratricopeptide repeat protein [unclassified Aquimarina]MBG6129782.1 signal transduction histidine kinase [Aquimarina sp. EL_35]MBG6150847.1 signal transduction histidine kinase [Aquimarina sp. EL_32]MBG6167846.1 signal transduction histidine kinase [Aquimarina sp. EL_43]